MAKLPDLRVLIAEDDHRLAQILSAQIEGLGLTVVGVAADGEEAVALAEALAPDLLLLDLVLPKKHGLEAAREILGRRFIPVIAITGHVAGGFIERATEIGVFAYLVKPFEGHALEAAIAVALAQYSRVKFLEEEVGSLTEALEARKLVERAKGILMDRFKLAEGDAMRRLQQESRNRNQKLAETARAIVTAHKTFENLGEGRKSDGRRSPGGQ